MVTYKKINFDLEKQIEIEGETEDTKLLKLLISNKILKSASQWNSLVKVKWHRYGKHSYQHHRFWYPSESLKKLINLKLK